MDDQPTSDHSTSVGHQGTGRTTRWQRTVGIVGLVVLLVVGAQTVAAATGAGLKFDHGPASDGPPSVPDRGGDVPHDPSDFGH